jgi:hypothetical protein
MSDYNYDDVEEQKRRQEIGRVNNEKDPMVEKQVPVEEQEIGIVNNEEKPHKDKDQIKKQPEIGRINNEMNPDEEGVPETQEVGRSHNEYHKE